MFLKVSEIAREINGEIIGNKDFKIEGICDIENGKKKHLSYVQNDSYLKYLNKTKADVIVVNKNLNIKNINKIFILVENAALSFIKLLKISKYNLKPIENSNFIENYTYGLGIYTENPICSISYCNSWNNGEYDFMENCPG